MKLSWRNSSYMLGWFQLSHGKSRMVVALCGVSVIAAMILTVLSLRDSVIDSSLLVPSSLRGDIVVLSPRTQTILRAAQFPSRFLERIHGIEGVESVSAVYFDTARWVNPETRQEHPIRVWGMELERDVLGLPGIDASDPTLRMSDSVLFDRLSRPKFGPVAQRIQSGGDFSTEVNGRQVQVCGLTTAGISISSDGNLFTTHANYQRLFPGKGLAACNIGIVRTKPGEDIGKIAVAAREMLGSEAVVLTRQEMIEAEREFTRINDPVDDIMGMIAAVAFLVGMIIVYQILYTDVINHLPQFATLKAIGFPDHFLLRIILSEGLILSLIGFWPGLFIAVFLTRIAHQAIMIPVNIDPLMATGVLVAVMVMCVLSAAVAVRKISQAEPADVF